MSKLLKKALNHKLNRRSFLKLSAGLSGALVASGALKNGLMITPQAIAAGRETIIPTGDGRSHCGNNCVIKVVVKDYGTPGATIVRVESDDQPDIEGKWQLRACARGRAIRKQVYAPERIKYPMKRKNWSPDGGANVHPELHGRDMLEELLDAPSIKRVGVFPKKKPGRRSKNRVKE